VPQGFDLKTKKKGFRRFWSPFTQEKLKELAEAEAALVEGQRDQVSSSRCSYSAECMRYRLVLLAGRRSSAVYCVYDTVCVLPEACVQT
jgi:hypothetical protein